MVVRIGQRLAQPRRTYFREWREFRGLTQEQVADRLGTSKSAVSKMERGQSRYNQSSLEAWANALSCEPSDLIARPPPSEGETDSGRLFHMIERAPPEERRRALAVIEAMLKAG
jgi:transcriptional regulator with XRE-family HTH domain